MSTKTTFSSAPSLPNALTATFSINRNVAGTAIELYLLSDNGGVATGLSFADGGSTTAVENWVFSWADDSPVGRMILANGNYVPGTESYLKPIVFDYYANSQEESASSCGAFFEDSQTAEVYLSAVFINLSGTISKASGANGSIIKITIYPNAPLTKVALYA